jgi:transcriptional regulator with XRE-family HTH domain
MTQEIDLSPISAADLDDHWFTLLLRVWRDVREAVKSTGIEQQILAGRIGMNPGQFSGYLTGKRGNITLRTLHNIARAAGYRLKVSLEPLASLRRPNSSFEAERRERVENTNMFRTVTSPPSKDDAWTRPADLSSRVLEPLEA